jgi:hypothetical protein
LNNFLKCKRSTSLIQSANGQVIKSLALSEGATEADLLDAYPRLTRTDIQAALAYAADTVAHETILLQTS